MTTNALNCLFTLVKFCVCGLVVGIVLVMILVVLTGGVSSLTSNNSSYLGTEKQWAQIMFEWLLIRGALGGLAIGFVAGLIRVVVVSRRGMSA